MTNGIDALRPGSLQEFAGQERVRRHLNILLNGAKERSEMPDHILLSGGPGLGKTTLSHIVAHELSAQLVVSSGPVLEKPADAAVLLSSLSGRSVLFIDEIHALKRPVEELLYSAMEDGMLDVAWGEKGKSIRIPLPPFTLVGATTQPGNLSAPLRDRFGFNAKLSPYTEPELVQIISRSAKLLNVNLTPEGAGVIASRSRGTARIANTWLRRCRDWGSSEGLTELDETNTRKALDDFGVDTLGLDEGARDVLRTLINQFNGGPVGLNTLAAASGESAATIDQVYEPYFMQKGLILRTPQGRVACPAAYKHLGLSKEGKQEQLPW